MPTIAEEDYVVPKCGNPPKVQGGRVPKDTGEFTSRLGQIKRAATKVPGPGMYVGHENWKLSKGFKFPPSVAQDKQMKMNKVPGAGTYNIDASTRLGVHKVIGGLISKGKKRSFLDGARKHAAVTPSPAKYFPTTVNPHIRTLSFKVRPNEPSRVKKMPLPGPNQYMPKWELVQERVLSYPSSKQKGGKFVDLAASMGPKVPGPGTYKSIGMDKISRGTKWCQIMGMGKNPLSGTF